MMDKDENNNKLVSPRDRRGHRVGKRIVSSCHGEDPKDPCDRSGHAPGHRRPDLVILSRRRPATDRAESPF
jgi:hypothetical protein